MCSKLNLTKWHMCSTSSSAHSRRARLLPPFGFHIEIEGAEHGEVLAVLVETTHRLKHHAGLFGVAIEGAEKKNSNCHCHGAAA